MAKKSYALPISIAVGNELNRLVNARVKRESEFVRRAVGYAAYKGAQAMRDKVLNSPTGTSWHEAINKQRGNQSLSARYETGTMFESIGRTYGKIIANPDRRKRSNAVASFGWPLDSSGIIKDAPINPTSKGKRMPDGPGWRSDPKYFMMQEYGFNNEGDMVPGMFSQRSGVAAAKLALDEIFAKRGYK
jgi:hypothetical protein